jgi:CRISPR-associated protein Cmr5
MSTRQQRWSVAAHRAVLGFADAKDDKKKKLKTLCMKMPALVQRSGAVQALAFVISRAEEGERFANAIADTLEPGRKGADLLEKCQTADLAAYLASSRDLIEVATWFRRFAQIELADVESE